MNSTPKAITVTKLLFIGQGYVQSRVTIPVARIDEVEEIMLSKYENNQPVGFKASKLTKVNGDWINILEPYHVVRDTINGFSVDYELPLV